MTAASPTYARRQAEFVAGLRFEDLPDEVVASVGERVLDTLGIALAASALDTSEAVRTRNVECPMNVTAAPPGSRRGGAGGYEPAATAEGHGVRCRVRIHRQTSRSDRPAGAYGLPKRSPSQ